MEVSSVYLAVATLASLLLLSKLLFGSSSSMQQQWPPGPKKLPFIGNLHQLGGGGDPLHWTLSDLARKYGKLMTVWFGSQKPNIVITDLDLAWELLVTKGADYWSRKMPYLAKITTAGFRTLSASDGGPYWESLRKGLHATALNPQTISSQTKLQEQDIADMISKMQQEADLNNGVVKPLHHVRELAIRLIYRLSFGTGVPIEDRFVKRMDELIEEQMGIWAAAHLVDVFEFTKHIPGLKPPLKETKAHTERIKALLRPCLAASKKYSLSGNNTHLSFLLSQGFSEEVILLNLFEVFNFGVDSTSASIVWALGFFILERETQEKLYKEVEGKLGGSRRMVRVEDIGGMEYVHAVVKETMRMRPVAPMAMPHKAARDTELKGLKVKEGTPLMVNLYALLHDEKVWKDPNRFVPERFLKRDGVDELKKMERYYFPFGAGRRVCPGIELAKIEVAVALANLVNSFEWRNAVEGQPPDLSETLCPLLEMKTPLVARVVPR